MPQGATKFSYSARISNCKILIADTGLDFLDVKVPIFPQAEFLNSCIISLIVHFKIRLVA